MPEPGAARRSGPPRGRPSPHRPYFPPVWIAAAHSAEAPNCALPRQHGRPGAFRPRREYQTRLAGILHFKEWPFNEWPSPGRAAPPWEGPGPNPDRGASDSRTDRLGIGPRDRLSGLGNDHLARPSVQAGTLSVPPHSTAIDRTRCPVEPGAATAPLPPRREALRPGPPRPAASRGAPRAAG